MIATLLATVPRGSATADPTDIRLTFSGPVAWPLSGHAGVDELDASGAKICPPPNTTGCPGGYSTVADSNAAGYLPDVVMPGSTTTAHLELYPHTRYFDRTSNDPWRTDIPGGVHIWVRGLQPSQTVDVGGIPLPSASDPGVYRAIGAIVAHTPITDGRLKVDAWQLTNLRTTTANPPQQVGAFVESTNHASQWTLGWMWPGQYIAYLTDSLTGVTIHAFVNVSPGSVPTLDLDAVCFGLDACSYASGAAPPAAGTFHPLAPARILDTRNGTGRPAAPVQAGDGRSADPSTAVRDAAAANHELTVTGRGGVPATGVSAVLLNVTAVAPSDPGYVTVYPKLPRGLNPPDGDGVWNDQSSFLNGYPNSSNLNFVAGDVVPNLVLARVGAGGKVRLDNFAGTVDVVADVVGWFDVSQGGDGYTGMAPARLLDTRSGLGGIGGRMASGETRVLPVAGVAGVPADASAAVLNVTAVGPTSDGFVTVWPAGGPRPLASTLNTVAGRTRPNLAVVKLGAGGTIALYDFQLDGGVDVVVDVVGYVRAGGQRVTAIEPQRLVDSRSGLGTPAAPWADGESRPIAVAGHAGVPANASGVFLNVTATLPTGAGFATVWPAGTGRPLASNLDFVAGDNVPNLVFVGLGAGGAVALYNFGGATNYVADIVGYVSP